MKFSELKGRAVVNVEDAKKIGEIENLLLDPGSRQVLGWKVKTGGLFSTPLILAVSQIRNIGPDAVTVAADTTTVGNATVATESSDQATNVQDSVELTAILGHKVVTDAGTLVGEVHDVLLDPVSASVTGYEVRGTGLFSKSLEIAASPEVRYGEKLITIPAPLPS